jgi:hypothetical protein
MLRHRVLLLFLLLQVMLQLALPTAVWMIGRYYALDEPAVRELLGKKLTGTYKL